MKTKRKENEQRGKTEVNEEQTTAALVKEGWAYVGIGFFCPGYDPTVDGFGPDGLEIRVYVPAHYGEQGPPGCEVTDMTTEMSLWIVGIPNAARARWLMRKHEDILIHTELGIGDRVLDLDTGEVVPEPEARR